ncbi:hypothetical protein C8A01DRAFT_37756 [Parachaetomium inaequale]|uniref:DNA replication regulator SLD2 n=1 Tax=Parachaetomium inaequale TaxID=2588326 RepID=A0AAN6PCE6_9PEZI|nr:hypothetical protein C8A01DRAFT_37756 [Parachaetomium inaequale]
MDDQARAAYEDQSLQLRADLKQWEGDWASAHAGTKPGRDDIKQNPDIALKYKQYSKLRDILAGKIPPPSGPVEATRGHQQQRKRTQSDAALPPQTPSKKRRPAQTPRKTQNFQHDAMPAAARTPLAAHAATPSDRASLTPAAAVPTSISPTPQRDGRVLGIFDLLGRTPSRPTAASTTAIPIAATPSKERTADLLPETTTAATPTTARFAATTPQSKRTTAQLLFQPTASTTTPHRDRRDRDTNSNKLFKTPSTNRVSKTRANNTTPTSSTPSFLRRRTISIGAATATAGLARVDEQDEGAGVDDKTRQQAEEEEEEEQAWKKIGPLRLPRKLGMGIGRSLSSVVAGLRRMEEEAFGEEEEVLREMEMGAMEGTGAKSHHGVANSHQGVGIERNRVEVGDSQVPAALGRDLSGKADNQGGEREPAGLLSGFDEEALYDSLDEKKQRQQQQPLRQFKKRGQKRTTRLVNMRPTRARRPAQTGGEPDEEEEEGDMVPETQFAAPSKPTTTTRADEDDLRLSDVDSASEMDFDASESDEQAEEEERGKARTKTKTKPKKPAATTKTKTNNKTGADAKGEAEGVVKRAVRKVKATAHANFKRLKLRNSGAKGGPGHNSRFRRRR